MNEILEWNFLDGLDDALEVKKTYSETPPNVYGYGHTPLYQDMIDAILNHRQPLVNGEEGKKALELILAIYQSSFQRKPIKLPLSKASTIDFKGQFKNE